MAVVIRMSRAGRRHVPFYHIGVFDSRTRRDGKPIEELGFHDPVSGKEKTRIDLDRAKYWLGQGARPSDTVKTLLKAAGISSETWTKKRKKSKSRKAAPAPAKASPVKRSVKKRVKDRTANSKTRAEKAKKK